MAKSTQAIQFHELDDLYAYASMWKAISKDGIHYHDVITYPKAPSSFESEAAFLGNSKFMAHKARNRRTDLMLYEAEVSLTLVLKNEHQEELKDYLELQKNVTRSLLLHAGGETGQRKVIAQFVEALNRLKGQFKQAQDWEKLLRQHKLLEESSESRQRLTRYVLYRKSEFVEAVRDVLMNHDDLFRAKSEDTQTPEFQKMASLLLEDRDLDLDALQANARGPMLEAAPLDFDAPMGMASKPADPDFKREYKATLKDIKGVDDHLKDITLALRTTTSEGDRDAIYNDIAKLKEKREMLSYVAEQQYKKLDTYNKAKESAKDWIGKNLFDKKVAGKNAVKVFFSTSGAAIGKLLWHHLNNTTHKVDTEKLKKEILLGLLETGLTAVSTYFFGPLSGTITKKAMSFFRDEPEDPYLEGLNDLKKQVDEGFTKIESQLQEISRQVTQELDALAGKLEAHHELTARKASFETQKDHLIALLKKVGETYEDIFIKRSSQVEDDKLAELDHEVQDALVKLVSIFYHDDFRLGTNLQAPGEHSLSARFLKYNENLGVPFHTVAGTLLKICQELTNLGELYLDQRRKWFSAIGATLIYYQDNPKKAQSLFHTYWNAARIATDYAADLTIELEMLKISIIGTNNIALLQYINRAIAGDAPQIDFLNGFGLEEVIGEKERKKGTQPALVAYKFKGAYAAEGTFLTDKDRSFIPRCVVAEAKVESNAKSYYTVYTQQENEFPIPLQLHLRLMPNDAIEIYNFDTQQKMAARVVASSTAEELSDSLESFFENGHSINQDGQFQKTFSLPVKSYSLSLTYDAARAAVVVTLVQNVQGRRREHEKFSYEVRFTDSWADEYLSEPFRFELKPVRDEAAASLEITVLRAQDKKKGKVSIIISDYVAMYKAGMSRGIKNVSTYLLKMPVWRDGETKMVDVRTDNLRPFMSNLMMAGDEFAYRSEELPHFGEILDAKTGWRSLKGDIVIQAFNENPWFVELQVFQPTGKCGSVFKKYEYTNSYSGKFIFQSDGNFVMYDRNEKAIAATGTHVSRRNSLFAYLNNEGALVVVDPEKKSGTKCTPEPKPEISVVGNIHRKDSNQMFVGRRMDLAYEYRIESENGEYYAEFWKDEVESGGLINNAKYEFSLLLRKKGGEIVKKVLHSPKISEGDLYPKTYLEMQKDGNLVAYHEKRTSIKGQVHVKREPMFASDTCAKENEGCILCLTNAGKLFLAKPGDRNIIKWLVE